MKRTVSCALGWLLSLPALGQGSVFFANYVGGKVSARVDVMGMPEVDGRYVAQLFAAPPGSPLVPVGDPVPFRDGPPETFGYFPGVVRNIPGVAPGQPATVRFAAWHRGLGSTYAQAFQNAMGFGGIGESATITVPRTGTDLEPPPVLVGLQGFSLSFTLGFDPSAQPIRPAGLPYDPGNPVVLNDFTLQIEWVMDLTVRDRTAFVAAGFGGLHVLDVDDPAHPVRLAMLPLDSTMARAVAVRGDHAYLAQSHFGARPSAPTGLRIVDVRDPRNPRPVARVDLPGEVQSVAVTEDGSLAVLGAGTAGLHIVDVRETTRPTLAGTYLAAGAVGAVATSQGLAYVAADAQGMHIVDLTDPAQPRQLGVYDAGEAVADVAVRGFLAVVSCPDSGLHVVDVSDASQPRRLAIVALDGGAGPSVWMERQVFVRSYWSRVDRPEALSVVDLRDPLHPELVGRTTVAKEVWGLALGRGWLWLADTIQLTAFPIGPVLRLRDRNTLEFTGAVERSYEIQQAFPASPATMWNKVGDVSGTGEPQLITLPSAPEATSRLVRAVAKP